MGLYVKKDHALINLLRGNDMATTEASLREHLAQAEYDVNYQDIEVLGIVGYDPSSTSWLKIESLYSFEGKSVCDLGCFHGYYAIKAREAGAASVIGLDRSQLVLDTAKMISELSGRSEIEYQQWTGGEPTPFCDVALVLNMLHHCADLEETLANINCQSAVFECNQEEVSSISKYFTIQNVVEGRSYAARPSRLIVVGNKI